MAQYYVPRARAYSSSEATTDLRPSPGPHADALNDPVYIFPRPSSSLSAPLSPSASDFSAPSDMTVSSMNEFSQSRSRRRMSRPARSPLGEASVRSQDGTDDPEVEVWDWTSLDGNADSMEGSGVDLEEAVERASRWELVSFDHQHRSHVDRSRVSRSLGNRRSRIHSCSSERARRSVTRQSWSNHRVSSQDRTLMRPHPPVRIPLLSFIASLPFISADESTLYLLTRSESSSSGSALFPGHAIDPDPTLYDMNSEEAHRIARLRADRRSEGKALREGIEVACDPSVLPLNPFSIANLPLPGLWAFVNGVWVGGGKALKEILGK